MNMIDYIGWRGDISFDVKGLNDIDNLIFSELAYMDLKGIIPSDGSRFLTISEVYDEYTKAGIDQSGMMNDPLPVLRKAACSERFMNVRVTRCAEDTDDDRQIQFSAVTFLFREGEAFVAFRGTDNTIIGWRECFNMSFLSETPGQSGAVRYLNETAAAIDGALYVGGHSKGGNFAVYASTFCDEAVRKRIVRVYSNDGPGFLSDVADSDEYKSVLGLIRKFVPDSSLVGNLLDDKAEIIYIKSSARGFAQHDPYTWCVYGVRFEEADERASGSVFMSDLMRRWLASLSDENKRVFVNSVFDSLDEAGVKSVSEISENRIYTSHAFLKAISKIEPERMEDMQKTLKMLLKTGRDVALNSGKKE